MRLITYLPIFFVISLCILLTGCYCCYHPPQLRELPEEALSASLACAEEEGIYEYGDWPEPDWWEFFEDEQLNCLIEESLNNHPNIRLAEANTAIAMYNARIAKAALLPTVDLHGEIYHFKQSKTGIFGVVPQASFPLSYTQTTLFLDFEYELDWWKKNLNNLIAKIGLVEANIAEEGTARLMLTFTLAQAYFNFQTYSARKEIYLKIIENREEYLKVVQKGARQGIRSISSMLPVERDIHNYTDQLEQLNLQIELDINSIQQLVGKDFLECIEPVFCELSQLRPTPLPCDLPLNLLAHRPEIVAQKWRIDSALHDVYVAEAQFYPDINLSAILGFQTLNISKLFEARSSYGYYGPAFNLPIFEGGKLRANLGLFEEEHISEILDYENLLLTAVREVLDALAQLRENHKRFEELAENLLISEQLYGVQQTRFEHHLSSQFDTLDAQRDELLAEDNLVQIWGVYILSQLSLFKALGGGFSCE